MQIHFHNCGLVCRVQQSTDCLAYTGPTGARPCSRQCWSRRALILQASERQQATDDLANQHAAQQQQQQQQGFVKWEDYQKQAKQQENQHQQSQQPALVGQASQKQQQQKGLYAVPWDIWEFIQVAAAVWVINMAIPYAVLSSAAHLQGVGLSALSTGEKEVLNLCCQFAQLGCTFSIINSSISKHQPLPKPWFHVELGTIPVFQGLATTIAAVGSGVLLAGFMTGHVDGAEEWRHLAGLHQDDIGTLALVLGALLLAPALEEYYFRGYILPSLTNWTHPGIAVLLTGLLFASAHPAESFWPEALLGSILSLSLLAADGNLLVPLLAHSLYNAFVLGTELLL